VAGGSAGVAGTTIARRECDSTERLMGPRDILIVDDTWDCLLVLRLMLERHGFSVRAAQSGEEALKKIQAHPPDVLMLDVMMPGMSGLELLERLRGESATAQIPVILVSARIGDDDVMAGYQVGADYYITKPCTAQQVIRGIALVLGEDEAAMVGSSQA
jgi:DNA-binding response OmpR family regulator